MNTPRDPAPAPRAAAHKRPAWSLIVATIGNALEAFDWGIYATFVIYFDKQFFPSDNPTAAQLAAFAVFAIGFLARPLGGWVFGILADHIGRRASLITSIALIACASLAIAILPTYSSIGVAAPILLTLIRLLQGLAFGGEYGAATVFLTESAPPNRRGFYASFQFCSFAAGMLATSGLALALTHWMTHETLQAWGWRIPFAIGGVSALIGSWLCTSLAETEAFEKLRSNRTEKRSLWYTWTHHPREVRRFLGVTVLGAFSFYLFTSFIPVYAIRHVGATPSTTFAAGTVMTAIFMLSQPLFGALSDRIGRRPQLIVFALCYLLFLYPVMRSVGPSFMSILLVELFGMLLYGLYSSIAPAVMAEIFPTEVRSIGIGATYNIVVAVLGGTTPYLMTLASAHQREGWFIAYVCVGALIGLITYWRMPETAGIKIH
ncbi:MAG: MFS transporter [Burkholderiaceae bacterium]|jgi:MHS family alpha-ketoglutarate permease-like MFS transporter|nr:MFS transporter [Burkholderiaceae bacterium]